MKNTEKQFHSNNESNYKIIYSKARSLQIYVHRKELDAWKQMKAAAVRGTGVQVIALLLIILLIFTMSYKKQDKRYENSCLQRPPEQPCPVL